MPSTSYSRQKLHALDTREHCRYCYLGELDPDDGDDYISADDFLFARCAVVANGRERYTAVLKNPARMLDGFQDIRFEPLLCLAEMAFEEISSEPFAPSPSVSFESFQNEAGWRPTSRTRRGRYSGANVPPGNRRPD